MSLAEHEQPESPQPEKKDGPLLFVAADPREFAGMMERWTSITPWPRAVHWARQGYWKGRPVSAMANGAGADRALAAVLLAGAVSGVCSIGFCGALDSSLKVGDVVVATGIVAVKKDSEGKESEERFEVSDPRGPESPRGLVASIGRIAATAGEKRALKGTGASVVEMESAGAARGAGDLAVPFYCVRVVSDLAGEDFANDFNAALNEEGRFSTTRLVLGALSSPSARFGELMRLRERTALAARKLGDFLAECRF